MAFLVSAALGFGVVKLIKSSQQQDVEVFSDNSSKDSNDNIAKGGSVTSSSGSVDSTRINGSETDKESHESNVTNTSMLEQAEALAAEEAKKKAEAEEARRKAEEAKARMEQNKMSAAEFQSLIAGGDNSILGGKNPKVSKSISFSVSGLREGERRPQDVVGIREKVGNGVWASFTVSSVGYDAQGKINSAIIVPHYPD